jgi:hypothetical protein
MKKNLENRERHRELVLKEDFQNRARNKDFSEGRKSRIAKVIGDGARREIAKIANEIRICC